MNTLYSILILGMGNVLMSDDGFGVYIAEALSKIPFPSNVLVLDIGTSAASYLNEISNSACVIIVDALYAGKTPGTVYYRTDTNIENMPDTLGRTHELSIISVLQQARLLTGLPSKIVIVGVEPDTLEFGYSLSPIIKSTIPKVIELIENTIKSLLTETIK